MSDEKALEHYSPVLFRYVGDGDEHLLGVPMRDVRLEDWDLLEDPAKEDLQTHAKAESGLYERVLSVDEARKQVRSGDQPERRTKKTRKGGKRKSQPDPDPRTPGRVDSDVVSTGQAVPPADEPIGESEPGFVQADTSVNPSPQEG